MGNNYMHRRFRGFAPVVIDVETGGTDPEKNPMLEMAAVFLEVSGDGLIKPAGTFCDHIEPFPGSVITEESLEINRIDPDYPLRFPRPEKQVMQNFFAKLQKVADDNICRKVILVGHNAPFDLAFINKAAQRHGLQEENPLHPFSVLDTVTIGALLYGQTILSVVCQKAGIEFNEDDAHSALYDAEKTAEVFCKAVNSWVYLGGWYGATRGALNFDPEEERGK